MSQHLETAGKLQIQSAWELRSEAEDHGRTSVALGKSWDKSLREIGHLKAVRHRADSGKNTCMIPGKTHAQERAEKVLSLHQAN